MRLVNHGGKCCGIKHIHGIPWNPTVKVTALLKRACYQGAVGEMSNPAKDFFPGPAPAETGEERLNRLLEYLDSKKKSHLVEITFNNMYRGWNKILKAKGFRIVSKFTNGNTGNSIEVYHRITKEGKVEK